MASNFLEQLIAEWYEFQGYFIRRNVLVGKRAKGGYECELDIVAFHPTKKHLIQIEPSADAFSWTIREKRYKKKFEAGQKYIPALFQGLKIPEKIDQVAVLVYASKQNRNTLAGGRIVLVSEILEDIFNELKSSSIFSSVIPEQFLIIRTLQFVTEYRSKLSNVF